jgi:glycosyltransferase involved in cell wall biosynthesis
VVPAEAVVTTSPLVSVIVPVFNDAAGLARCLDALMDQQGDPAFREIIVVDNGSEPSRGIPAIVARHAGVRYVHEARPGSYAARNAGLRQARGEIIAFTDADCVPASDWVERGRRWMVQAPALGLLAGRIDVVVGARPGAVELYDRVIAFPQEQHVRDLRFGATANVFTTRQVVDRVGPFDPRLKSRGDLEWGQRVAAAGYQQAYAPDVVVRHPARRTFQDLYRRMQRVAGGVYATSCRQGGFFARQRAFVRAVAPFLVPPVRFALSLRRHPDLPDLSARLKVVAAMAVARYASAWALIRLKCGAAEARE